MSIRHLRRRPGRHRDGDRAARPVRSQVLSRPGTLKIAKEGPEQAAAICTAALNAFKALVTYLQPILPSFGEKVAAVFGEQSLPWEDLAQTYEDRACQPYQRLVERVDPASIERMVEASRESLAEVEVEAPEFSLDPLVGAVILPFQVIEVQPLPGDRYHRIRASPGSTRLSLVEGLGTCGLETALVGSQILAIANVAPREIAGHSSNGMILAIEIQSSPAVLQMQTSAR